MAVNSSSTLCGLPMRDRSSILTLSAYILGPITLVCIALRLLQRPERRIRWLDKMDDWIMVVNAVSFFPAMEDSLIAKTLYSCLSLEPSLPRPRVSCAVLHHVSYPVAVTDYIVTLNGYGKDLWTLSSNQIAHIMVVRHRPPIARPRHPIAHLNRSFTPAKSSTHWPSP